MRILFYCDTVFSFGGVQRVLAEIAKALSGKHEVTILTTDTCTDLSMYGYAESTVLFDYFSYSASFLLNVCYVKAIVSYINMDCLIPGRLQHEYAASFFPSSYKRTLARKINARQCDVVIGVHAFMALHLSAVKSRSGQRLLGGCIILMKHSLRKKLPICRDWIAFFKSRWGNWTRGWF